MTTDELTAFLAVWRKESERTLLHTLAELQQSRRRALDDAEIATRRACDLAAKEVLVALALDEKTIDSGEGGD